MNFKHNSTKPIIQKFGTHTKTPKIWAFQGAMRDNTPFYISLWKLFTTFFFFLQFLQTEGLKKPFSL